MEEILFVMTSALPFPAVRGGAVQTLVQHLIEDNEKQKKYDITVASIPNKSAKAEAEKLRNTKLCYSRIPGLLLYIRDLHIRYLSSIAFRLVDYLHKHSYIKLEKHHYKAVIYENEIISNAKGPLSYNCRILHLHNDYINTDRRNSVKFIRPYSHIFCVSDYIKNRVCEVDSNSKAVRVYNGIDVHQFKRNIFKRDEIRKKYGIKDEDIVFIFAARMVREKGILELIKAFNQIPDDLGKNAVLLVLGGRNFGQDNLDEFGKTIHEEGEKSNFRVIFTGYVDYDKISEFYSASDVGCMPSMCEEACPLSLIEYMAASLPVIVSNSGGMLEIFLEGCGVIVDKSGNFVIGLSNAIKHYIKNPELIHTQGERAFLRSEQFSVGKYCQTFWAELRKCL